MTLTLNIPTDLAQADNAYREKLRAAASAMHDAGLITPEQAAELSAMPAYKDNNTLRQGSPEWKAELRRIGESVKNAAPLSLEATSREALYGDDLR